MTSSRLLAAAVLCATLAVPATAGAAQGAKETRPTTARSTAAAPAKASATVSAAVAVGRRYWGAAPCQGQVKVLTQRPVAAGLEPDSDAWVTFDTPLGPNDLAAPASSYTNCTIALARWRWPTSASMVEDWDMLCTTMIHELGHLHGHAHDNTPGSVMTPVFTDLSSAPPICRSTRPGRSAGSAGRQR